MKWKAHIRFHGDAMVVAWEGGELEGPEEVEAAWRAACRESNGGTLAVTPTGPFIKADDFSQDPAGSYLVLAQMDDVEVDQVRFSPYRPGPLRAYAARDDRVY